MVNFNFMLFSHKGGPNPWKNEQHLFYNPNGRVPTLIDHQNNDYAIWESDAILVYLADRYDKERNISLPHDNPEYHHLIQYLFFQSSGQGVIWGQAGWFNFFHQEPVASAVTRYRNEIKRVLCVLESILQDKDYLVAGKFTIADLSFVAWNDLLTAIFGPGRHEFKEELPQLDFEKEFPKTHAWHKRLIERPAVVETIAERKQALQQ
ncbi:glutathione S-transferase Gst2 [Schizosaccharomyces cryophilus OY26]|uniref:glutathione transferase n=1 Tax=Schizosaccharomyces cryophilus (strain OY26 / ATCC MYA-4695 / CBS 11777 / NBRC 106824 / NRRL Y48691) TaxID=653667 RepID=S9VXU8_SCHCR|nr:glutathione S-transferase Gst2 [Schizosaccharomyces cryophilus OY26]EPY51039.1 glutathione S-transferase Gst2 [Schizosaccharomyces cryophilus OY26]